MEETGDRWERDNWGDDERKLVISDWRMMGSIGKLRLVEVIRRKYEHDHPLDALIGKKNEEERSWEQRKGSVIRGIQRRKCSDLKWTFQWMRRTKYRLPPPPTRIFNLTVSLPLFSLLIANFALARDSFRAKMKEEREKTAVEWAPPPSGSSVPLLPPSQKFLFFRQGQTISENVKIEEQMEKMDRREGKGGGEGSMSWYHNEK